MKIEMSKFPDLAAADYLSGSELPPELYSWLALLSGMYDPVEHHAWDDHKSEFYTHYNARPNRNLDTNLSKFPAERLTFHLQDIKSLLLVGGGSVTGKSLDDKLIRSLRQKILISSLDPHVRPVNYTYRPVSYINKSVADRVSLEHHNTFDAVVSLSSGFMDLYPHLLLEALSSFRLYAKVYGLVAIDINASYVNEPFVFTKIWHYNSPQKEISGQFVNISPLMLKTLMKFMNFNQVGDYPYTSPDLSPAHQNYTRYLGIWQKLSPIS